MTSTTNPSRPRWRRRTAGGALALTLTGAAALGTVGLSPAAAATVAWDPTNAGLERLPDPSVIGEWTVTQVTGDTATMRSFVYDGQQVDYATTVNWRDVTWGPAGDVVSGDSTGGSITSGPGPEALVTMSTPRGAQWSPYGDSLTRSTTSDSGFKPAAAWVGGPLVEQFGPVLPDDPGAATVFPNGGGVVVGMGTAPARDLGVQNIIFPRVRNTALDDPVTAPVSLGYSTYDAHDAAIGADGTLAFVGTNDTGAHLYVDEGQGPTKVADLGLDCPGQRPAFAPSGTALVYLKNVGDTCAKTELRILAQVNGSFSGGVDHLDTTSPDGSTFEAPTWRAKTPAARSTRLSGSDRVGTGVAISSASFVAHESPIVVLASSGTFPDAIVGGPLAGTFASPLLITPSTKLDSRVLTEIKRVLMPGGTVVIIGGTGAVSSSVQTALSNAGIATDRLGGADRFGTSVKVAQAIDDVFAGSAEPRSTAFLADGMKFPDALVAGPAATGYLAPVLLTNGTTVPSSVKSYATGAGISAFFGVGGSAATAGAAAFPGKTTGISGADRYATSQQVAQYFFPGAGVLGYASGENFPDALTGGALMAGLWQPLMLARASTLPSVVSGQAYRYRASTDQVLVFGGTAVVSDGVRGLVSVAAGTQTANFGPDVLVVPNPKMPATAAMSSSPGARGSGGPQAELKSLRDKVQQRGADAKLSWSR
jgi:Cell wall binding domain 2 (CWB2)